MTHEESQASANNKYLPKQNESLTVPNHRLPSASINNGSDVQCAQSATTICFPLSIYNALSI